MGWRAVVTLFAAYVGVSCAAIGLRGTGKLLPNFRGTQAGHLVLVRHGETEWGGSNKFIGWAGRSFACL